MHREDLALCLLTREDFSAEHENALYSLEQERRLDWNAIFLRAERQRVSPLVHYNINQSRSLHRVVPSSVQSNFRRAHMHNILKKRESRRALVNFAGCCADNHIDLLLIKGGALSLFVQRWPWSLISGDIDVILRPTADATQGNVQAVIDFAERYNHQRDPVSEHIEYEVGGHHDVSMNRVLCMTADDLWRGAAAREVDGWPVWIQSPEMMFISACINACRKRYFFLKSLHDVATICRAFPRLDWDEIAALARRFRADLIVFTALTVTEITLGCSAPPDARDRLALSRVRRIAIERMANALWQQSSLDALSAGRGGLFGRTLSAPLALTYLGYHWESLPPKIEEILRSWFHLHRAKPVGDDSVSRPDYRQRDVDRKAKS